MRRQNQGLPSNDENQPGSGMLVGHLHWLIQTLHMLVGIGAIVLTGELGARHRTLKRRETSPAAGSQALR